MSESQFAIIDVTYVEGAKKTDEVSVIEAVLNEVRDRGIPHLLICETEFPRSNATNMMSHSKLKMHCYLATYSDDHSLRDCVDHALSTIFSLPDRDAKTDPQIPSLIEFRKRA